MIARLPVSGLLLLLGSCGGVIAPSTQPVALPTPDEAHRVKHPAGYSIVFPADLLPQVNPPVYQGDSSTKDAVANENPRKADGTEEFGGPMLSVRRFSDEHVATNAGKPVPSFFRETQFQNQPAFAFFDPGYGSASERSRRNTTYGTAGGYQSTLHQELIFQRGDSWFHLSFSMYNLGSGEPVHTRPLQAVEQYFETFAFDPDNRQQ